MKAFLLMVLFNAHTGEIEKIGAQEFATFAECKAAQSLIVDSAPGSIYGIYSRCIEPRNLET